MIQFLGAHKIALLVTAALVGGFFIIRKHGQSNSSAAADQAAQYVNGFPVDPYAGNGPPAISFDLSSLLPDGPAAPVTSGDSGPGGKLGGEIPEAFGPGIPAGGGPPDPGSREHVVTLGDGFPLNTGDFTGSWHPGVPSYVPVDVSHGFRAPAPSVSLPLKGAA